MEKERIIKKAQEIKAKIEKEPAGLFLTERRDVLKMRIESPEFKSCLDLMERYEVPIEVLIYDLCFIIKKQKEELEKYILNS